MKMFTIQPSPVVDFITEDGTELTQSPYPYHVDWDGLVGRQDFWNGSPYAVIGFVADLYRQEVDLWWDEAREAPESMVGMYLVTRDADGAMGAHVLAVSSVNVS